MALLLKVCGKEFTLALGYDWFNRTIAFPVQPYTSILIPIMGGGVIVLILTLFGFLTQAIQQSWNVFIGTTRLIVAMSMDRLLPDSIRQDQPALPQLTGECHPVLVNRRRGIGGSVLVCA